MMKYCLKLVWFASICWLIIGQTPPIQIRSEGTGPIELYNARIASTYVDSKKAFLLSDVTTFGTIDSPQSFSDSLSRDITGYFRRFILLGIDGKILCEYTTPTSEYVSQESSSYGNVYMRPLFFGDPAAHRFLFGFASQFQSFELVSQEAQTAVVSRLSVDYLSNLRTFCFLYTVTNSSFAMMVHTAQDVDDVRYLTKYDIDAPLNRPLQVPIRNTKLAKNYFIGQIDLDRFAIGSEESLKDSQLTLLVYSFASLEVLAELQLVLPQVFDYPSITPSSIILPDSQMANRAYLNANDFIICFDLPAGPTGEILGGAMFRSSYSVITGIRNIPQTAYLLASFMYASDTSSLPSGAPTTAATFSQMNEESGQYFGGVALIPKSELTTGGLFQVVSYFSLGMVGYEYSFGASLEVSAVIDRKHYFTFSSFQESTAASLLRISSMEWSGICFVNGCSACEAANNEVCSQCGVGYYLVAGLCYLKWELPSGWGLSGGSQAVPCAFEGCRNCRADHRVCARCGDSYSASPQGKCFRPLKIELKQATGFLGEDHLLLDAVLTQGDLSSFSAAEASDLVTGYFPKWSRATFLGENKAPMDGSPLTSKFAVADLKVFSLRVGFQQASAQPSAVQVTFSHSEEFFIRGRELFGLVEGVETIEGDFSNVMTAEIKKTYEGIGSAISGLAGSTDSYVASTVFAAMMAFDVTGLLLRFAQVLKIVNKVRLMQLNFGPRLSVFLKSVGDMFVFLGPGNRARDVENSVGFRGAISKQYIDLEFGRVFVDKIVLYLISWALLAANFLARVRQLKLPVFWLHVMHYHPKVHLLLFNIVVVDFCFYGARSILHTRSKLPGNEFLAYLSLALISADFFILSLALFQNSLWEQTFKINLRKNFPEKFLPRGEELRKLVEQQARDLSSLEEATSSQVQHESGLLDRTTNPESNQREKPSSRSRTIDYRKTYAQMHRLRRHVEFLSAPLAFRLSVNRSPLCRGFLLAHTWRVLAYQIFIVAGQYASGLLISVLLAVEGSKLAYTLWGGGGPFLNNKLQLLADVLQSAFMGLILAFFFFLHFRSTHDVIQKGPQLFGVTVIVVAVLTEWLLTLINIVWTLSANLCFKKKANSPYPYKEVYLFYKLPADSSKSAKPKLQSLKRSKVSAGLALTERKPSPVSETGLNEHQDRSRDQQDFQDPKPAPMANKNSLSESQDDVDMRDDLKTETRPISMALSEVGLRRTSREESWQQPRTDFGGSVQTKKYPQAEIGTQPKAGLPQANSMVQRTRQKVNLWTKRSHGMAILKQKVLEDCMALANNKPSPEAMQERYLVSSDQRSNEPASLAPAPTLASQQRVELPSNNTSQPKEAFSLVGL